MGFSLTISKYISFAALAILLNILCQKIFFFFYSGYLSMYLAMAFGTAAGLLAKYALDKRFIFFYKIKSPSDNLKKLFFYSITGVLTTLIFWGLELAFFFLFKWAIAKYLGALLGLLLGYSIKYFLDKKFVFKDEQNKNNNN